MEGVFPQVVFTLFGIPVRDSVISTWVMVALVTGVVILVGRRWPAALETLVLQNLSACIDNQGLSYKVHYWRTTAGNEVDFVLYGDAGLIALEVKRSRSVTGRDVSSLKAFKEDYPSVNAVLLYGGVEPLHAGSIRVLPIAYALSHMDNLLRGQC